MEEKKETPDKYRLITVFLEVGHGLPH